MGKCSSLSFLKCCIFLLEPTHEMYLNGTTYSSSNMTDYLEPTHEMYLNTTASTVVFSFSALEPTHEMYLNKSGTATGRTFLA